MKLRQFLYLLFIATAFLSAGPRAQVIRDYDRTFDFQTLKKYAWLEQEKIPIFRAVPVTDSSDQEIDQLIRAKVDEQLQKKKFEKVSVEEADFLISYLLVGELDLESQSYDSNPTGNIPYGHWRPFYQPGSDTVLLRKGTLTLDIVDREDKQLAWRGSASETITKDKQVKGKIEKAIKDILKKFPPK